MGRQYHSGKRAADAYAAMLWADYEVHGVDWANWSVLGLAGYAPWG